MTTWKRRRRNSKLGWITARSLRSSTPTAIDGIDAAIKRVTAENLADSVAGWTSGLHIVTDATKAATDTLSLLAQASKDAQAKLDQLTASYTGAAGQATALEGAQKSAVAAQTAYTTAVQAATALQTPYNFAISDTVDRLRADGQSHRDGR